MEICSLSSILVCRFKPYLKWFLFSRVPYEYLNFSFKIKRNTKGKTLKIWQICVFPIQMNQYFNFLSENKNESMSSSGCIQCRGGITKHVRDWEPRQHESRHLMILVSVIDHVPVSGQSTLSCCQPAGLRPAPPGGQLTSSHIKHKTEVSIGEMVRKFLCYTTSTSQSEDTTTNTVTLGQLATKDYMMEQL